MHVPAVQSLALALGVGSVVSLTCQRLKIPPILALLSAGLLLGRSGIHVIGTYNLGSSLDTFITVVICILVYEGALRLGSGQLEGSRRAVLGLLTIGAAITFGLALVAARYCAGLDWPAAVVMSGVLIVTGPTVVQPLLRRWNLKPRLAKTLWAESVLIEPIGALTVVVVLDIIKISLDAPGAPVDGTSVAWKVALPTLVGPLIGVAVGMAGRSTTRWLTQTGGARPMEMSLLGIGACLVSAGVGEALAPQSGLVAATVCGLCMGEPWSRGATVLREFKEQVSAILVGGVLVLLGSRFEVKHLADLHTGDYLFVAILVVAIRPIAAWASTTGSDLTRGERAFVGFIAPRGVVAASVAGLAANSLTEAAEAAAASGKASIVLELAAQQADHGCTIIMLVILTTVTVSSLVGLKFARWLEVDNPLLSREEVRSEVPANIPRWG